jgi:hypothetical protein
MSPRRRAPRRLVSVLVLGALLAGVVNVAAAARLPGDHAWQVVLREHLTTLSADDFVIASHEFTLPEDYAKVDDERLYRDWIVLGHLGREPGRLPLHAEPAEFTLDRIEGDAIASHLGPAGVAWWAAFDYPGNPYASSDAVLQRAVSMTIVDMLMLEGSHANPRNIKADFMGANLGTWAYTYGHAARLLPEPVRSAYREGMLHYLAMMERIAPRDQNTNMDTRIVATLAELDEVFGDDPTMHARLVGEARRILFGDVRRDPSTSDPRRGMFHPAGYIGEADGPETSYNGISLFHLAEAAMITHGDPDWDAFLPEVVERMVRFKALNHFPEPDGTHEGPSSWAKRTNDPYPNDQRDRPWRRYAEAMLTDEALFRLRIGAEQDARRRDGLPSRDQMLADARTAVLRLNRAPKATRKQQMATKPPVWVEDHWPADLPYTWDHYVDGAYARFQRAAERNSELLAAPYERPGDFTVNLDGEFWAVKRGDWGFQVEAVPHMGRDYDVDGSGALAGGSLAAFWTRSAGVPLLGRLPDKWNYVTWDKIDQWPTHHLWGRTAAGPAFSSARQREPWVRFDTDADPPRVHVFGELGSGRTVESPRIISTGYVYYRRTFTLQGDGLHVLSELLSNEDDEVTAVWETLPVFAENDTTVEFRIDGSWRPAPEGSAADVSAVRLARFDGAVLIDFDAPQRVRLGGVFTTAYQKQDRMRTLNVDLLHSGGKPATMPRRTAVGYLVHAE